ncbi:hypothetical protein CEXT_786391 [Caerostris extrusa]|uniref:Uncharacterized protein n=1 Tax=Caerostris extrusa TaxID=172846 RepID=A0AAV4NPR5_CAEEX|nr:hypothetical protein CEXT_786391 [Caerostris extrusa]
MARDYREKHSTLTPELKEFYLFVPKRNEILPHAHHKAESAFSTAKLLLLSVLQPAPLFLQRDSSTFCSKELRASLQQLRAKHIGYFRGAIKVGGNSQQQMVEISFRIPETPFSAAISEKCEVKIDSCLGILLKQKISGFEER